MKFLEHVKLAGFIGLATGVFHGTVDVIARLSAWSFEWFELYQTLLLSSIAFTFGFILLSLIIELLMRVINLRKSKKIFALFYFATALALLICFYSVMYVNGTPLLLKIPFSSPLSLAINFGVVAAILLVYILFLIKGKGLLSKILHFFMAKKVQNIIKNYIYFVIIFVIVSFFMDIYLLNYVPSAEFNEELKEYPNVLLIVLDTTRADHLSVYGYPINTSPNIDKLAQDSIIFNNAVSASTLSLQSHSTIFTGKYVHNNGVLTLNELLSFNETTLAEILRDKGYNTAGFIGNTYTKGKYGIGQGFTTYKDRMDFFEYVQTFDKFSLRSVIISRILPFFPITRILFDLDKEKTAEEINGNVFKWLNKNKNRQPFFMFINYYDPHYPYDLGSEFKNKFTNDTRDFEYFKPYIDFDNTRDYERYREISSNDIIDGIITLYDIEIFYMDYHIGKLLEKFDELGLKDNTIIIITADHGEEFYFEHGYFGHGFTLYEEGIHVPLIIYYPKEFEAKTINKRVGIINIFPTILDMLNIRSPEDIDGISLLPLMENGSNYNKKYVLSELFGREGLEETKQQAAISDDDWKLIEITQWDYTSPEEERISSGLFNLKTDPKEQRNLYDIYIDKRRVLQDFIKEHKMGS